MALTGSIPAKRAVGSDLVFPVAANAVIFQGSAVALDAAGNAVEPSVATGLTAVGVAEKTADNSAGDAGDKTIEVRIGCYGRTNSTGADEIKQADVGKNVYFVDGGKVAKGDTGRSIAGRVAYIRDGLVYVNIGFGFVVEG